ncbi:hypothetical protein AAH995_04275 [Pseudomonas putida]|uniref:hypothetical protein n=1 Tax=Pseudomonas TaxID=286 RepID=UPI002D1E7116|nr:hypothetical protein [Pseudomonas guariconensis]MEB3843542.1 zinc ribbon domain-containing protein [Pseudomonas guariconensis]MEB3876410.1 zinc ribbon domain-containing protein [Pseudomonas guariconensis]MEB3881533.1 zinc ribbon domain-containing protein [Pseudomonas guariconensis]MEB3898164.1 zinc ribbon domain-containing protein [Pseudomonas guariconensis]
MRALGKFMLVLGVIVVVFAISMDVSVSTGSGRVNNIGLMAQRQNYTLIGGMLFIAGLLVVIFAGRKPAPQDSPQDCRTCPFCAEQIKSAAIKCKHCGADVDPVAEKPLKEGWVASIPCKPGDDQQRVKKGIESLGYRAIPMAGADVAAGPFKSKDEAKLALELLSEKLKFFGSVTYRDSVTGDYPPL